MRGQETARAEAAEAASAAATGGEAAEREPGALAAAAARQEAVCRGLLHELRFKKHAALEAGGVPLCAPPAPADALAFCGSRLRALSCRLLCAPVVAVVLDAARAAMSGHTTGSALPSRVLERAC